MDNRSTPYDLPRASMETPEPVDANDNPVGNSSSPGMCPADGAFTCNGEGVAMTGRGYARMYSALDGIQTLTGLLVQRELNRDYEGADMSQCTALGLLNAMGCCAELAHVLMNGDGGQSRAIGTSSPGYPELVRLVQSRPG